MSDVRDSMRGSVRLCATSIVAGVLMGFVGGAFRWCLHKADGLRVDLVDWAHTLPGPGWLIPMAPLFDRPPCFRARGLLCAVHAWALVCALIQGVLCRS